MSCWNFSASAVLWLVYNHVRDDWLHISELLLVFLYPIYFSTQRNCSFLEDCKNQHTGSSEERSPNITQGVAALKRCPHRYTVQLQPNIPISEL